ncbi:hypothetical protein HID58_034388 [Brassica napus]|uniref:Uncharacterized protein n=1 Tax=Brassica napus TaxID=3708 RepID=A0ABQ8C1X5_BRANA|nr:hypothetical protein HID58_034388 [Brassica napus]
MVNRALAYERKPKTSQRKTIVGNKYATAGGRKQRRIKAIKDMKKFIDDCEEDREKNVLMELPKLSKSKNKTKSKSQYLTNLKVVNAAI